MDGTIPSTEFAPWSTNPPSPCRNVSNPRARSRLLYVIAVLAGAFVGAGLFTFRYAEGLSYFSTDPAACANCHIMQSQYDSWQKASHHTVANCVDCHLPHGFVAKYLAKASNGYHHSKGFTFQDFEEPIRIKAFNRQNLQENCVGCHGGLVHDLLASATATGADARVDCIHCHRDVGHGDSVGLGGPPEIALPNRASARTNEEIHP